MNQHSHHMTSLFIISMISDDYDNHIEAVSLWGKREIHWFCTEVRNRIFEALWSMMSLPSLGTYRYGRCLYRYTGIPVTQLWKVRSRIDGWKTALSSERTVVSKRNFTTKGSFCSLFQALQDWHAFALPPAHIFQFFTSLRKVLVKVNFRKFEIKNLNFETFRWHYLKLGKISFKNLLNFAWVAGNPRYCRNSV